MQKGITEKVKNVLLVVLFVITILLLYLSWNKTGRDFSVSEIIPFSGRTSVYVSESDIVLPKLVLFTEGDSGWSVGNPEDKGAFEAAKEKASQLLLETSVVVSEISEAQYKTVSEEYASVRFIMAAALPFSEFCVNICGRSAGISDSIGNMKELAFSEATKDSFFIKTDDRYYRILSDIQTDALSDIRAASDITQTRLYSASKILGRENDALIPVGAAADLANTTAEVYAFNEEILAEEVFGDTFVFVRKISDKFGNTTYMYSYGAKRLAILADGSIEYKEDISSGESGGFYSDLETALQFLSLTDSFDAGALRLTGAEELSTSRLKGYRFVFNQFEKGIAVDAREDAAVIEVLGGKVSYAKRSLVSYTTASEERTVNDAANVIAQNSSNIYYLLTDEYPEDGNLAFNYVAGKITSVDPVYYFHGGKLLLCWRISVGERRFYCDIETGEAYGLV